MNVEALTNFEKDLLLRWFLHPMEQPARAKLATNFPQVYNKLCGDEVVEVNTFRSDLPRWSKISGRTQLTYGDRMWDVINRRAVVLDIPGLDIGSCHAGSCIPVKYFNKGQWFTTSVDFCDLEKW